jgi:hypothetical protein
MFAKILYFGSGALIAAVVFFWIAIGGIAPPAPQETTRIEVNIARLKPEDQWLEKVHFQIIPLDGVRSLSGYAILLATPPPSGVHPAAYVKATLDLTASKDFWTTVEVPGRTYSFPEGIQPIGIESTDFGHNGDQSVVKFIDEEVRFDKSYYRSSQPLFIGSSPF